MTNSQQSKNNNSKVGVKTQNFSSIDSQVFASSEGNTSHGTMKSPMKQVKNQYQKIKLVQKKNKNLEIKVEEDTTAEKKQ